MVRFTEEEGTAVYPHRNNNSNNVPNNMGARNDSTITPTTDMARTTTIISMREAMPTGMARDIMMTSIKVMGTHNTPNNTIHKMAMAREMGGNPPAEDMAGWDTAAVEGGPHQGKVAIHQMSPNPIQTQTVVGRSNEQRNGNFNGDYQDRQLADQMYGMDINDSNGYQQRMPPGPGPGPGSRGSSGSQRSHGEYGRQIPRGQSAQGYSNGRGYAELNGYGHDNRQDQGRQNHEFGPPGRSMTTPISGSHNPHPMGQPQRKNTNPYDHTAGQGVPARPSTAAGNRAPPQRSFTGGSREQQDAFPGRFDDSRGYGQQSNGHGPNFNQGQGQGFGPYSGQDRTSLPDFDAIPQNTRGSFDDFIQSSPEQRQPGAHQTAQLSHAKSQPDLRQPQTAVFEMAPDAPSVPPMPSMNNFPARKDSSYSEPRNYNHPPRGASRTPAPGQANAPAMMRPGGPMPPVPPAASTNPDALPSHPIPVRAGLMENSMVNMNNRPPPVRNYGGVQQLQQPKQQNHHPAPQRQQGQPAPQRASLTKPQESPVTAQELEHLRMVIKNNSNDQASALRLAKRLIEASDVLVASMPDPKSRGKARERYIMDAHKILKKLCNAGNTDAMFVMADCLGRGLFGGGDHDTKEAFTLYQSAAKAGHAAAAYRTAVCCEIGSEEGGGTRKDPMKAIQWYKRAAALGDTPAMYKIGMILLKGLLGQQRNPREAVGWLKRAAERADAENPHALHELGLLFESAQPNDAILRDEPYALSLFQQAADLGYKFSQFRLGCAFEYGLMGCRIDPRLSIMWYSKAAQQGEHQAELALSGWYLTGSEGVLGQSDTEAYLWARKAAIAGLAKAEYAMGYFTEVGIGIAANLEDAKRWYWRAAAQDFPKARERLEELKRAGRNAPRQRERISRTGQQEGECSVM
ncbi:unnamed protein product [Clonostachys rosea]|uniref:Uncharacterized protein n=1 Tax=Bionectria ochroleuca TaxID=29856 RepID=A0ABY6UPB7_BIOOC|nr:unnamed protein product [Clonostachys rosea]